MHGKSILLLALIYTAVVQDVKAAKLTITPSQNLRAGATSLTLRCSPDSNSEYTKLLTIDIAKRTLVQNSPLMPIAILDTKGLHRIGISPPKYTVTGTLAQSFLQVVIDRPDDRDTAEYQCLTRGKLAPLVRSGFLKVSRIVTVNNVIPGNGENQVPPTSTGGKTPKLTITPSQNLQPGATSLTLRCSPNANSGYTKLLTIQIAKRTLVQNSPLMPIAILNTNGLHRIGISPPKYTVTGILAQSFLQVVIERPDDRDAAEYQCLTWGELAPIVRSSVLKVSKNVTVHRKN